MDLYKELGLDKNAGDAEIKKAYRAKAFDSHPDRVKGREHDFKAVAMAYRVLSDPVRRKYYDETGGIKKDENKNAIVYARLIMLFQQFLEKVITGEKNYKSNDVFKLMERAITEGIAGIKTDQEKIGARIKIMCEIEARIKYKKEKDNIFINYLVDQRRLLNARVEELSAEVKISRDCLKFLKGFKYQIETEAYDPAINWGTFRPSQSYTYTAF